MRRKTLWRVSAILIIEWRTCRGAHEPYSHQLKIWRKIVELQISRKRLRVSVSMKPAHIDSGEQNILPTTGQAGCFAAACRTVTNVQYRRLVNQIGKIEQVRNHFLIASSSWPTKGNFRIRNRIACTLTDLESSKRSIDRLNLVPT
jgi:hypothetical protein